MATETDEAAGYDPNLAPKLLAEAARLIQAFSFAGAHVTVVGGLVPGLLVPVLDPGIEPHVGTRDLDLCLSVALVDGDVGNYERLEACLKKAGFQMTRDDAQASISWRWVGGLDTQITVEFFCPAAPGRLSGRLHRPGGVVGGKLSALVLETGALIDADTTERSCEVILPGNEGKATVPIRVTNLAGYLAAKTDALKRRSKNKDAYDVVWLLEAWPGGPAQSAAVARASPIFADVAFKKLISELGEQFKDIDAVGARRFSRFMSDDAADPDASAQRAVSVVKAFLSKLWGLKTN